MYFLQAAKDIIANEGVENASIRKIADAAGYAYPTIYNYFKDLNELLWETKRLMVLDLVEAMRPKVCPPLQSAEALKEAFRTYIRYYLENPRIFRFFYLYTLQKPRGAQEDTPAEPDFGAMWNEAFKYFVTNGRLREENIDAVARTLIYATHGMLMLSFSNNGDLSEEANLYRDLDKIIDYLL